MTTIAEGALRRYGRATYDVTARLAEVGDELYIRTRASLDDDDVCDVNDRLARGTYSQSLKSFPRQGPSSPRITVVIASPYPPYNDVTPRQMSEITTRLLKPTLVSRLRQTQPVPHSPPPSRTSSRSTSSTPRLLHPPGYLPPSFLRLQSSSCGPSFSHESRTEDSSNSSKDDLDRTNPKVRFTVRAPVKTTQPSPYGISNWRTSKQNTSSTHDNKPKDVPEVARSQSAPARTQRTPPEVDSPKALPRRERLRSNKKDGNTKSSPQKQKKTDTGSRAKKAYTGSSGSRGSKQSTSSQINRSQSSSGFNRLSFIATILETEDEYEDYM